jgi:transposase
VPDEAAAPLVHAFRPRRAARAQGGQARPGRKQQPCRELLECLRDRQDDVLRFTTDLRIPPTSNQAERDLRPAKTQRKISGRLRSETATRHRYAIRGYIDTARKHRQSALNVIRDALAGNPWMPPLSEPP